MSPVRGTAEALAPCWPQFGYQLPGGAYEQAMPMPANPAGVPATLTPPGGEN